jgi:hypothetical protein
VYVATPPHDPDRLFYELSDLLSSELHSWRHPSEYFNKQCDAVTVLRAGFGLLLNAPEPLAEKVGNLLSKSDVKWNSLPFRPLQPSLHALIAGSSFVIAEGFRVE